MVLVLSVPSSLLVFFFSCTSSLANNFTFKSFWHLSLQLFHSCDVAYHSVIIVGSYCYTHLAKPTLL